MRLCVCVCVCVQVGDVATRQIQDLLHTISGQDMIFKSLQQMGVDSNKLPICEITEDLLERADQILHEIRVILENLDSLDGKEILRLSYEYYSIIPSLSVIPDTISTMNRLSDKFNIQSVSCCCCLCHLPSNYHISLTPISIIRLFSLLLKLIHSRLHHQTHQLFHLLSPRSSASSLLICHLLPKTTSAF